MPGIRIHHATLRNCTLIIEHPGEIRSFLRTKNRGRGPKDYHIKLDNDGNSIVSETVWIRLQEAKAQNFIVLNEVNDPPRLTVGLTGGIIETPAMYRQIGEAIEEIAPPGIKTYVRRNDG